MPAEVQTELIDRAGGNPLYAEEFVRMVEELGSPAGPPESVQGIIAARLDALPLEEKILLQDAAVSGKVFWLGTVERIGGVDRSSAEEALHSLGRKEFVRREARSSVTDQAQYVFRHTSSVTLRTRRFRGRREPRSTWPRPSGPNRSGAPTITQS